MKKNNFLWNLLTIVMAVGLCVSLESCPDDDPNPKLIVTGNSNVQLSAEGTSVTADVTVTVEDTDWNLVSNDSWLRANKSGQKVIVSADKNGLNERQGTIIISATEDTNQTFTLYVTQKGEAPYIKVNGMESNTLEFQGSFDGKSGIDYKQTIAITSNVAWTASGIPSWLSVSPSNGNGSVQMEVYPTSEYLSASDRDATITLSGNGVSAQIVVKQKGPLSDVKVIPSNLVSLYNQIGWNLIEEGKVNKFHWLCISDQEMSRMTDKELLEALLNEESNKFVDDYMFFPAYDSNNRRITEKTSYYICTVAFDVDDNRGEVVKSKVTTPAYLDADNDAWVSFPSDEILYGSSGFQFTAKKEGYCDTYHVLYGNLPSEYTYPAVAFAFEINYYAKNKKKHWLAENWELEIVTNYPNTHSFSYITYTLDNYPLITIFARGVFKDGKESSDMTGGQWDVSGNGAPKKISRPKELSETVILRRSVEEARAKQFFHKK